MPLAFWEGRLDISPAALEAVFGVFIDARLAGAVGLRLNTRPKSRHKAFLFGLYVNARCTGRGAGAALVEHAIAFAAAREGVALVQLSVIEGNGPAHRLYERAGFRQFGLEPCAIFDEGSFKGNVHMWLPVTACCLPRELA